MCEQHSNVVATQGGDGFNFLLTISFDQWLFAFCEVLNNMTFPTMRKCLCIRNHIAKRSQPPIMMYKLRL